MQHQFKRGDRVMSPGNPPLRGVIAAIHRGSEEIEINYVDVHDDVTGVDYWPISDTRLDVECTTCGELATHLYAVWHVATSEISSINGLGRWSPACPDCDTPELVEPEPGVYRITGPLEMWSSLPR